jgi:hypothetical protein
MSEPLPEGMPPGPEDIRRIVEDMAQVPGNAPDMQSAAIQVMAGLQVQWYLGWIAAGAPEPRAAEWARTMIQVMFQQAS